MLFFKQKTAYEMRISDWSSDVCSSDLVDVLHPGKAERGKGMAGDVRSLELVARLGEHARDVQRDIARAYYSHGTGQQRWIQMREGRVTIVPADQSGRTDHARQLFARNAELSVARSAGRHHDRVVKVEQLGHRHRTADIDIADETDIVRQRGGFIAPRHRLD